jgi:hypothetical protein
MDKMKLSTTENTQINEFELRVYACSTSLHQLRLGEPALNGQILDTDEPRIMTMRQVTFKPAAEEY